MNDKMEATLNAIGKYYRSEITIHDIAVREYDPYHTEHLYLEEARRILDDLTKHNLIKMIIVPIINERFYKINKEAIKKCCEDISND